MIEIKYSLFNEVNNREPITLIELTQMAKESLRYREALKEAKQVIEKSAIIEGSDAQHQWLDKWFKEKQ